MKIVECKKCGHRFYEDGVMKCPSCGAGGKKLFNVVFSSPFKKASRELVVSKKIDTGITLREESPAGPPAEKKVRYGLIMGKKANYIVVGLFFLLAGAAWVLNMMHEPAPASPPETARPGSVGSGQAVEGAAKTPAAAEPAEEGGPKGQAAGKGKKATKNPGKNSSGSRVLNSKEKPDLRRLVPRQQGYVELMIREPGAFLLVEPKAWESLPREEKMSLCRKAMDFLAGFSKEQKKPIAFLDIWNRNNRETLARATLGTRQIEIYK